MAESLQQQQQHIPAEGAHQQQTQGSAASGTGPNLGFGGMFSDTEGFPKPCGVGGYGPVKGQKHFPGGPGGGPDPPGGGGPSGPGGNPGGGGPPAGGNGNQSAAGFIQNMMQMMSGMGFGNSPVKELSKLEMPLDNPWKRGMVLTEWMHKVVVHAKGCSVACGDYVTRRFRDADRYYQLTRRPDVTLEPGFSDMDARLVTLCEVLPCRDIQ